MTHYDFTQGPLSAAELDAVLAQARIERAEAMHQMLSAFAAWVKRLAAHLKPAGEQLPQAGAWALRPRPSACTGGDFA